MYRRIALAVLCALTLTLLNASAQIPRQLSYQGHLADGTSPMPDGSYSLQIRLYGSESASAALYSETHQVDVRNGYFSVLLGSQTPFPASLDFSNRYFLGVSVNGAAELTPRTALASSPYALNASHALNSTRAARADTAGFAVMAAMAASAGSLLPGASGVVRSINGSRGDLVLVAEEGIELRRSPNGDTLFLSRTTTGSSSIDSVTSADSLLRVTNPAGPTVSLAFRPEGIPVRALDATGADSGSVIQYNGTDWDFVVRSTSGGGLELPFVGSIDTGSSDAFMITNKGSGSAGRFRISNTGSSSPALWTETDGGGAAFRAISRGTGAAGTFEIDLAASGTDALTATTNGDGSAIAATRSKTSGTAAAIEGKTSSTSNGSGSSLGATGVYGEVTSTSAGGWSAGVRGLNRSTTGNGIGVAGIQNGSGWGVLGESASGTGVRAATGDGGNALVAVYTGNSASVSSANNIAVFLAPPSTGGAARNQARIDNTGKGYFNGGTVNSGADVAELFDVEQIETAYEPGDVLAISASTDRTVTLVNEPYSTAVLGVYATRPGVLLTEAEIDEIDPNQVPLGVIGVIPTKVSDEGGPITRGDLLVSSSTPGVAMKGDPQKIANRPGSLLGKALESHAEGIGLIKVFVNVR